jgi:2-polyprenyl-3-methyl-5-hydroxy-6-metoxy-1,4-benzoquinol methylase
MGKETESVCPWWMGYLLALPIRKYMQNPDKIVGAYLKPGMKAIDYGSAMGFFSLPMARAVGPKGKVYCFDLQEKMLGQLVNRAKKAGLGDIIKPRLVTNNDHAFDDLKQKADFALLFAVAHEVPDRQKLFVTLASMMKPKALLLFAEPKGHVSLEDFEESVSFAEKAGFVKRQPVQVLKGLSMLLEKK